MDNEKTISLAFAAIDKSVIQEIPSSKEVESRGDSYVSWGPDNLYCEFLFELYQNVPTLSTVIEALSDYATGNEARCTVAGFEKQMNHHGDSMNDMVK